MRGFQTAVAVLDRVIVAEMQGNGDDLSAISAAADNAFDAGAVVIAANGNNGPGANTVNTPANAHQVIGVGNFDVQTQNQIAEPEPRPRAGRALQARHPGADEHRDREQRLRYGPADLHAAPAARRPTRPARQRSCATGCADRASASTQARSMRS